MAGFNLYASSLSVRVMHTLYCDPGYQEGSGSLGLIPSLVVGDALPFSRLPIDNGSCSVSSLCSNAAGTGLDEF